MPFSTPGSFVVVGKPARQHRLSLGSSCCGGGNFLIYHHDSSLQIGCSARQAWHARILENIVDNPWQAKVMAEMRGCLDPDSIRMLKTTFFRKQETEGTFDGSTRQSQTLRLQRVDTGFAPNSSGFDSTSFDSSPTAALLLEV